MVQPAWPFWPDLRAPEPYGAETYREYEVSQPYGVEPYREYDVLRPEVPIAPPLRATARVDLNTWRSPDRSQPTAERVLQGRVVTVLERSIPSRDPLVGEWWRVVTPTGFEGYLAGAGPSGELYLDILPGALPGLARTGQAVAVPREPVPGDPCLTGDGCLVHPPHVINPNAPTRIKRSSLRASTARIPRGGLVDVLSPQVNVTVTEREEDGEIYAYFTPDLLGSHTFYRIRFCYPGTDPLRCVDGWTERYNLVPGARPGTHVAAEESSFWEDVGDFVTDPDTWAVIGTIATVGSYGYLAGILGSAQAIATQEAMKGLAGMFFDASACVAAGNPVAECTIGERSPNFINGWKAQVAIRARLAAVALAGPAVTSAQAALATQIPAQLLTAVTAIAQATPLGAQWRELEELWKRQKKSDAEIQNEFLAKTQRDFANDPDPMKRREDVQAIGVNYHLRRNLFDTIHWDPVTGQRRAGKRLVSLDPYRPRSNSTLRNYSVEELEALWRSAEQRGAPRVIIDAFKRRYETAKRYRDNFGELLPQPRETIELRRDVAGDVFASDVPPADRAVSRLRSFLKDTLVASVLTSPAWVPLLLLPWLRKRRRPRSRSRGRRRSS